MRVTGFQNMHKLRYINSRDVQRKNVINNEDMSSLKTP